MADGMEAGDAGKRVDESTFLEETLIFLATPLTGSPLFSVTDFGESVLTDFLATGPTADEAADD